ncbi:MAG: iron uptake porin [Nostoc sp. LLA-1]|nr:iron uptake porin [Cyanocohniella sp. LLY]
MSKFLWNYGLLIPALFNGYFVLSSVTIAAEKPNLSEQKIEESSPNNTSISVKNLQYTYDQITSAEIIETPNSLSFPHENLFSQQNINQNHPTQSVTSVSELSDVQPTDWAFQALQSLAERYQCLTTYPTGDFQGNRAITRYEFAYGLNTCLDRINQLIATSTENLVTTEDLATLQNLREQFASELVALRGRLDALEERTAKVEASQFSTTTKLVGDAFFVVADPFGDRVGGDRDETNTFLGYRARLNFQTSFTGQDLLTTLITAASTVPNLAGTTGTHMTRFTFDSAIGNNTALTTLTYRFPVDSQTTVWVGPVGLQTATFTPTLNGSVGGANGALSRFSAFNPTIYRPGFEGAGAAITHRFSDQLQLNVGYIADNNQASTPSGGANGFFNANHSASAQLTFSPTNQLDIGLAYVRKYFGTGTGFNLTGGTGSAFARNPFEQNATTSNNFGLNFNWRTSSRLIVGGWFGYTLAQQANASNTDATIINSALTFAFLDLGKPGNTGGIVIGVPPKVTSSNYIATNGQQREDPDTSLHLEAFYTYRVNNNITITPALFVITNPEHNNANDTIWVGALRTNFSF